MYLRKPDFHSRQETPLMMTGTISAIHDEQRREALLLVSVDTRDKCINLVGGRRGNRRNLVRSANNRISTVRWFVREMWLRSWTHTCAHFCARVHICNTRLHARMLNSFDFDTPVQRAIPVNHFFSF